MINAVVITDGETVDEPLHRFIESLGKNPHCTLRGIVVLPHQPGTVMDAGHMLWKLIAGIDKLAIRSSRIYRPYLRNRTVSEYNTIPVKLRPGNIEACGAGIEHMEPDVLVWASETAPFASLRNIASLGMLAMAPFSEMHPVQGPQGFDEALHRRKSMGFRILHWNGLCAEPQVRVTGKIPVSPFCSINRISLREKGFAFLQRELERLAEADARPSREPAAGPVAWNTFPSVPLQLHYLFARLLPEAFRMARDRSFGRYLQGKAQRWSIAYLYTHNWLSADLRESREIKNPARHYLADPMVWSEDGRHVCFAEDFDYDSMKGTIAAYAITAEGSTSLGTVLEEPFHLSFPFIFRWNGQTWMCPDTRAAGEIRLYRCDRFPMRWSHAKTIMRKIAATDTMLVEHGNRWWMLTNIDTSALGERCSELHVFHADRPDCDEWTPHPGNPVVFDSERARNGGLLKQNGRLYRAFQTHGFNQYGESMGVAEITMMTPETYEETVIAEITPGQFPGSLGIHTLSYDNGLLATDVLRREALSR